MSSIHCLTRVSDTGLADKHPPKGTPSCTDRPSRASVLRMRSLASLVLVPFLGIAICASAADFSGDPPSELASVLARKAKRAQKAGDLAEAYVYYSQASALQPRNRSYRTNAAALQVLGAAQIKSASTPVIVPVVAPDPDADPHAATDSVTDGEVHHALLPAMAPDLMFDSLTARQIAKERKLSSPPKLNANPGLQDFDLNDTTRGLFQKVAASFNLQVVFDNDYPQGGQLVRFRVKQVDYRAALDTLQSATNSFVVPVSDRAILVARDTVQKRNDLEQYIVLTLNVPQVITTQELTEIVQVVRQTTSVEKIGWDTNTDQIVIRDRVSRAALAQALLDQLFSYHPEVMIDLELLQVSSSDIVNYGFNVTNSLPLVYLSSLRNSVANIPAGVTQLLTFGGGKTLIGLAAAQVQALFNEATSESRSLFAARLRAGSGQSSVFRVGEKYPLITSGFVGGSTSSGSTVLPSFVAPPAISFENLGLDLKATPRVHGADEVTMGIEASYEALTGQSADGIPVIQNTKITSEFRIRNDEWAVVGGVVGSSDSKTIGGFWGLAAIPLIGDLFRHTSIEKDTTNFLIGVRPHILYMGPEENVTQKLRAGTDQRPYTPL